MKIKIISARNIDDFEHSVNEFVKDKHVLGIKYTSFPVISGIEYLLCMKKWRTRRNEL